MSAGESIAAAHKSAAKAVGLLSLMMALEKVSKKELETAINRLEEALKTLKTIVGQ